MIENPAFSRLGLGITGPHAGLATRRSATVKLIREAVGLGVTLFDTGPAYGRGEGEKRLGEALAGLPRDKVFVSTKAGIHVNRDRDFSPGAIEMSIKGSLSRLKSGHIDLLLLHGPAPEELSDKLLARLDMMRQRGLVRHLGVCGRGLELDAAISTGFFDALMAPLNAASPAKDISRLERARADGLSVIGIEIMAGAQRSNTLPRSTGDLWYLARAAKHFLTRHPKTQSGQSAAEALDWALRQKAADSVMCLTTRLAHLAANAQRAGLEAPAAIP